MTGASGALAESLVHLTEGRGSGPAVIDEAGTLTYDQLEEQVSATARAFLSTPVRPWAISIETGRERDTLTALLAALRVGLPAVFSDPFARRRLHEVGGPLLRLGPGEGAIPLADLVFSNEVTEVSSLTAEPGEDLVGPHPQTLAYITHTSGTTDRPKWIGVPHRALAARLGWSRGEYPLSVTDRVLWQADPSFDFALWEMLGPLASGATVVVSGGLGQRDLRRTAAMIHQERITAAHFVPSVLRSLLSAGLGQCLANLKYLFVGGEQFDTRLLTQLQDLTPARIYNQYGPTETCIDSTFFEATSYSGTGQAVPIGEPIDGSTVHLLKSDGLSVRESDAGEAELGVGGLGLARGYLGDPRATADRFVPAPDGPDGARVYRTGDLVTRNTPDGPLVFAGRRDEQVKVNGVRVELDEVRGAVSAACPAADVVVTVGEADGHAALIAYVTIDEWREDNRRALAEDLAPTKRPRIVPVGSIPRLGSGKPDLSALRARTAALSPDTSESSDTPEQQPPSSPAVSLNAVETSIAGIWKQMLGIETVQAQDNFFDLGGHSLLATELAAAIEDELGIELPLGEVFDCENLSEMAARVEGLRAS